MGLFVVTLDRDDRVHEGQHAEDECLHEVEQHLEAKQGDRDDGDGERRD